MQRDTSEIKNKIIQSLELKGPSLPIFLAREIKMDLLFTSAFLSELKSEKKILTTFLRVGSSPVYYLRGQEEKLEKFSEHLKSKEKEAYLLLKEKKFLIDSEQSPAIRVALREIKDFAKPFQKKDKLIWRYFLEKESNYNSKEEKQEPKKQEQKIEKQTQKQEKVKKQTKKKATRKSSQKQNEKFFNKVKEFLSKKQVEISDIVGVTKNNLTLIIKSKDKESLLVAYNKKRITETEIVNAYKKAQEYNLTFSIFSLGEPAKKITTIINASKKLDSLEKID